MGQRACVGPGAGAVVAGRTGAKSHGGPGAGPSPRAIDDSHEISGSPPPLSAYTTVSSISQSN